MKFKNVYIKVEVVKEVNTDELDCALSDSFNVAGDECLVHINVGERNTEGYPVKIDTMIDLLTYLKNEGANYVELDYHVDHYEYEMTGLNIEVASNDLVKSYESTNNEKSKLEAEYQEIVKKATELRKQISKL